MSKDKIHVEVTETLMEEPKDVGVFEVKADEKTNNGPDFGAEVEIDETHPIVLLYDYANQTTAALIQTMLDTGNDYISKVSLPLLRPVMYRRYLKAVKGNTEEELFTPASIMDEVEEMISNGEYQTMLNDPHYSLFCEVVECYIEENRHRMDNGNAILIILREFSQEVRKFMQTLNDNVDKNSMKAIEVLISSITSKMDSITQVLNLVEETEK